MRSVCTHTSQAEITLQGTSPGIVRPPVSHVRAALRTAKGARFPMQKLILLYCYLYPRAKLRGSRRCNLG